MSKRALDSRAAIQLLVESFYEKVKLDDLLGPVFNNAENFDWDTHIPILVDFWETILLDTASYKGNTMRKHIELNKRIPLTTQHFDRWKELFFSTIDNLFEDTNVHIAKRKVHDIAGLMQYRLQQNASN